MLIQSRDSPLQFRLLLTIASAVVVRQKLRGGGKSRGGDASGSYFSIEMGEADLEAGVVNGKQACLCVRARERRCFVCRGLLRTQGCVCKVSCVELGGGYCWDNVAWWGGGRVAGRRRLLRGGAGGDGWKAERREAEQEVTVCV